ncbi:MAG: TrkH family potassium uptake protein, partial [Pseudomonadota bacterium]
VVMGVWVYLMAYIGATVALMLALTLTGVPFDAAMRGSVGAISNTGPLVDPALATNTIATRWTQVVLSIGFVLGRVEVLALMPLFAVDFWRR